MSVRIGLLAASRIATKAVIEPARSVEGVAVVAVAARSRNRAEAAAAEHGIPFALGSYEDLLASTEVDAVYIGTPASLHRPWALAAIAAGKHVLVEKPFAANAEDAAAVAEAAARAPGVVVMEAFHSRYHPIHDQIREIVGSGVLGELRHVDAGFTVPAPDIPRDDIRWDLALGGGALMDLGVYPANWLRWVGDGFPAVVAARAVCPVVGVDGAMEVDVRWDDGVTGRLETSMITADERRGRWLVVEGSAGRLRVDNPLAPQEGASLTVEGPEGAVEHPVSSASTYDLQLTAFRDAVAVGDRFPTTVRAAVETMEFVDAAYRAAGLDPRPTHPS